MSPIALALLVLLVGAVLATLSARLVFVPLGMTRAAYSAGKIALGFAADPAGGALFLAAWAHLRRPSETDRLWLEAKLSAAQPLGGAGIAAMGLLALARKDLVQARLWLESLDSVLERAIPPLCA